MSRPKLSVVVVFYNMRREAERTLFSLTEEYQRGIQLDDFEVIAIDNGSEEPLAERRVLEFGRNFRYIPLDATTPSPAPALNRGVSLARGEIILCLIDGARILSPGIFSYTLAAFKAFTDPFVYTLSMHLGPEIQNESMLNGYDQRAEDELLESVDWRTDGYQLFRVSTLAASNSDGFFAGSSESNGVALRRETFRSIGGFDERFEQPGGGIVNLDFFNRLQQSESLEPVMLLGEATFHQFHGGAATNCIPIEHPWNQTLRDVLQGSALPGAVATGMCQSPRAHRKF